jgi:hypothetical protein
VVIPPIISSRVRVVVAWQNIIMEKPTLTEPGVKYFLGSTLKECRLVQQKRYTLFFNIGMTALLLAIFGGFLYYRYKGKLTPAQMAQKNQRKKEYLFTKLQQLALVRKNMQPVGSITALPEW